MAEMTAFQNLNLAVAGPCYRCLFPKAPQPESCLRCSDAGVLGVVPGIIGTLQVRSVEEVSGASKENARHDS